MRKLVLTLAVVFLGVPAVGVLIFSYVFHEITPISPAQATDVLYSYAKFKTDGERIRHIVEVTQIHKASPSENNNYNASVDWQWRSEGSLPSRTIQHSSAGFVYTDGRWQLLYFVDESGRLIQTER